MNNRLWDVLSILGLLATCGVAAAVLMIFGNPNSSLNLFPPPTEIPTVQIPTATPTRYQLPPTWTPTSDFQVTATLANTQTPVPTSTSFTVDTFTPTSTFTNTPTETPEATMTYTPGTDQAQELSQSPADGAALSPGADFDLRWEIKNIGTNDWSSDYDYYYKSGVEGSGADTYDFPSAVNDGDKVTIIIDMVAPSSSGSYSTTWALRNDDGETFKTLTFTFSVK
jgi:hypothetical protein